MKKGLLSILAASAFLVGCQNYDDQFDALNTQITALQSEVAGLAGVQATITSLQGQLSSLQAAALTSADLDAALSEGLSEIEGQVSEIAGDVENVASADDLASVSDALTDAQEDIDQLLEQGNVFSGDVIINTQSSLDAFHQIGASLAIVNGNVTITAKQSMDQAKIQEVVDNIITITKDFTYTSEASSIAETTFNNLAGVQTMTLKQAGGYQASSLGSAAKIVLNDTWKSKITMIDFRSLTQVETLVTGSTNHSVDFNKATEIHLTALARYGSNLTIKGAKNGVIDITALRDVGVDGDQAALNLTISGPESMTIAALDGKGGTLTVDTVGTLTVNSYDGTIAVKEKVGTVNIDNAVDLTGSTFADTENMTITGVVDPNTATDKDGPSLALTTAIGDLANVTLSGTFKKVQLENHNSLANVTVSADVTGEIILKTNSDLVDVELSGSKATGVTIEDCDDLTSLTVDTTMRGTSAAASTINGKVVVKDNEDLEELTVSSDKLETLTITGNTALETVDFTGVKVLGSATKANVTINGNSLTATSAQDKTNATGCSTCGNGQNNDLGAFVTSSGIGTLKTYLNAVRGDSDSKANVHFDTIESILDANGNETSSNKTYASNEAEVRILKLTPNTAALAKPAQTAKRSFVVDSGADLGLYGNNTTIFGATPVTLQSNNAVAIATQILTTSNLAAATAAGITMTATDGGDPTALVDIGPNTTSVENSATAVTTNFTFNVSDTLTISVEGYSATVTGTAYTTTLALANAWVAAWDAKYTTDNLVRYDVTTSANAPYMRIKFTARDRGTGSLNKAIQVSHSAGKGATYSNVGYIIGNDASMTKSTSDNSTKGSNIVLTLAAATGGSILSEVGYFGLTQANAARNVSVAGDPVVELSSTFSPYITASNATTASNVYPHESRRSDVVLPVEGIAADPSNAVTFNRVHWL